MRLTVAMCTYNPNRETMLRALDAIVAQLGEVPSTEVIVVDNNSSPPLVERGLLSDYPIRLIVEPRSGLTAAREAVIRDAVGEVIVFVDDDNILADHYLTTVVEIFSTDPQLGLLGGCILPEYETKPPAWLGRFEHLLAVRRYPPELRVETTAPPFSDYFPVGAGLAVRRDLALAYLDDCAATSRIEGRKGAALSSGEDLDLGLFALSQGKKLAVTGTLSLTHVIPTERIRSEYLERLAVGNVMSSLALERKWSPRLGHSVYPAFSKSLATLLFKTTATWLLGFLLPRYRIRRRSYATLIRIRFAATI
jgi:hypothetical protein